MSGAFAQPKRLQFKYLTTDNGLSSSIASCIIQDHKGFMWIGTPDGLNRYDGFNFVIYKNNPEDSASLADNVIRALFEDHNKNLFIGTENGLCMYDRIKDRFLNFFYDKVSPLKGLSCTVSKIIEDSTGNLWLATNLGLVYFDRLKNRIDQYSHDANNPASISNNNVEYVFNDRLGRLWVATRGGLNIFLPESRTFKHVKWDDTGNSLSGTAFINIAEDMDGNIWFGSTDGLYCLKNDLKSESDSLKHYFHDARDNNSLSINLVRSLFVDDSGNIWIGTDNGGLNLFNKEKQTFWHYGKDDYDPRSLNNEAIESICQDKTGKLWIGTYTGGLNISLSNGDAIVKYENLPGTQLSLSHNTVTCFSEDLLGQIWVGTDGGGLNLFDRKKERFRRYNTSNSSLSSNAILCIHIDSLNHLWLGTWAGGLDNLDLKSGRIISITTNNSGIQDDNIFAIAEGRNNDLWLGSFEHGLMHYEINKRKFTGYTAENSGLGNDMIIKIVNFSQGRLLIGTTQNFQIFSPENNQFLTYRSDPLKSNSLSYPRVTDILPENDSSIWIGTPDGLNQFNPKKESFKRYYKKDGLPDNFIKGLILDEQGFLWVTTGNGVCRFDYKHGKFKNYVKADGFQSNEFSERSILRTNEGDLLMGGTRGFNLIFPEKISENKNIPDVLITDLKVFNKRVIPGEKGSPLSMNITESKFLNLSHELSVLTFNFAVMDFSAPEKNQYAYMMENFDKDWIYTANRGEATYTNLNPGNYVFRVKGTNNDGLWNEKETSIQINILPPWWNTWWFRVIFISSLIIILVLFYYSRTRQLKNQKILLEKAVALKTIELKELNTSKDKFFSIIAHDLKNPFSTIIGFSEMLNEEINAEHPVKIKEFANMINTSAVQTLRLLENLLEWANSQRGKISFNPRPVNLNELLMEEVNVLSDIAKTKNIDLKNYLPDNLTISADKNMIRTILRNLISNAIKFTHKNGTVEVRAAIRNNQVEISVSDNGIGMTREFISKLFSIDADLSTRGTENEKGTGLGLFLCKEFVEKHHGKIWVESVPGKGSIFRFVIPSEINNQKLK